MWDARGRYPGGGGGGRGGGGGGWGGGGRSGTIINILPVSLSCRCYSYRTSLRPIQASLPHLSAPSTLGDKKVYSRLQVLTYNIEIQPKNETHT